MACFKVWEQVEQIIHETTIEDVSPVDGSKTGSIRGYDLDNLNDTRWKDHKLWVLP